MRCLLTLLLLLAATPLSAQIFLSGAGLHDPGTPPVVIPPVDPEDPPDGSYQSQLFFRSGGQWVYGDDGAGNELCDWSYVGYKRGQVYPAGTVRATLSSGATAAQIASAIATAATFGTEEDPAVVLLQAGTYTLTGSQQILINQSHVLLRGVGSGTNPASNTIINRTGTSTATVVVLGGTGSFYWTNVTGSATNITDAIVPNRSRTFTVADSTGFAVGDAVILRHPGTTAWLTAFENGGVPASSTPWVPSEKNIRYKRNITAINGNEITVDTPFYMDWIKALTQCSMIKLNNAGRIRNVGIRNLRIAVNKDDASAGANTCLNVQHADDLWVENVVATGYVHSGVRLSNGITHATIKDTNVSDPRGTGASGTQYSFTMEFPQNCLIVNCTATGGRHNFGINAAGNNANGELAASGIVFLDCTNNQPLQQTGGHRHAAHGILYDNFVLNSTATFQTSHLALANNGNATSGSNNHGWGAFNSAIWQAVVNGPTNVVVVQEPPIGQNFAIGVFGDIQRFNSAFSYGRGIPAGDYTTTVLGWVEGAQDPTNLWPQSLYRAQLEQREGPAPPIVFPGPGIRVNAGGEQFTDSLDQIWLVDSNYTQVGGGVATTGAAIAGTVDDILYRSERWGASEYSWAVPNGTYTVTLHFSENTWNAAGARLFNIEIEGVPVETAFDVWTEAGNASNTAISRGYPVTVADEELNIEFLVGSSDQPKISAIEITLPNPPTVPITVTNLAVSQVGDGQVTLTWTKASNALTSNLVWDTSPGVTAGDTIVTNVTSPHTFAGTNGTTYYFRIQGENAVGTSALSNEVSATPAAPSGLVIFVSPTGSDANGGLTIGAPKLTVAGARDAIRTATTRTSDGTSTITGAWSGATVIFAAGRYYVASATAFDERDSGTEAFPITYQAADGAEVILTGALLVPNVDWDLASTGDAGRYALLPAATRAATYQLALADVSVTAGTMPTNWEVQEATLRLIDNSTMQRYSRHPNGDDQTAAGWLRATSFLDSPKSVTVSGTTMAAWSVTDQNPMLQGAFYRPYEIDQRTISAFANVSGSTRISFSFTPAIGSELINPPFFAVRNMLQALDQPGEWVLLNSLGLVYYLPVSGGAPTDVSLSVATSVLTFGTAGQSAQATKWVTLKNLIIEGARSTLITADFAEGFVLDGCEPRNFSGAIGGIAIRDSTKSGLRNCEVHHGAVGAMMIHGGDWRELDDAQNFLTDVHMYDIGWEFISHISTAILPTKSKDDDHGSGLTITRLNAHDIRDGAIGLACARLVIEDSTFDRICTITGDAAALSAGFMLTPRYGVIRRNTLRNIRRLGDVSGSANDLQHQSNGALNAIYLDLLGGWTVEDNIFDNCDTGIIVGAGKDHIIRRNRFTNWPTEAHYDAGILAAGRAGSPHFPGVPYDVTKADLELVHSAVGLANPPWSVDFPLLIEYREGATRHDLIMRMEGNVIVDNVMNTPTATLIRIHPNNTLQTVSGFTNIGLVESQLNYPNGSSVTTPVAGGGTATISTVKGPAL